MDGNSKYENMILNFEKELVILENLFLRIQTDKYKIFKSPENADIQKSVTNCGAKINSVLSATN